MDGNAAAPGDIAEDIVATSDVPPFCRAGVDGYAVIADEIADAPVELRVVGESRAGGGMPGKLNPGEAMAIMTGAPVPEGANAVQLIEVCEDEDHTNHHDSHHKHGSVDPHYWQDPQNMILATKQITKELILLFPNNKVLYDQNRDAYIKMLKNLDSEYKESLLECELDTIIVNHNAFSYLSKRYGFHVEALSGLSPEAQPSGKNMIKLIEYVREHKTPVIFFESFVSNKAIKSIAQEAKVEVDVLQPLGNITADEAREKLSYEEIMRRNLKKIAKALKCR